MPETFKKPAFDDSLVLPQWIQYNARHSPEHALFVYESSHGDLKTITWSKAAQSIEIAAHLVHPYLKARYQAERPPPVVGILANLDSITYHILYLAVLRAGGTVFPISTRNSPVAVSHLLKETGTHMLFVSADDPIQKLAAAAVAADRKVDLLDIPSLQELYSEGAKGDDTGPLPDYPENILDLPAIIWHSSGSTAFPNPISLSHRIVLQWARCTKFPGLDMSHHRMAAHALPVFHGMGVFLTPLAARTGLTLALFPPRVPPVIPSPPVVLDSAIATKSTFLFCVPFFIELWSRSADDVEKLKQFTSVLFSGGPLGKTIGDELSRAGVSLTGFYGSSELGSVTQRAPQKAYNMEWDWLHMMPEATVKFEPQEDDPELFELVYAACPTHSPAITNCELDGKRAYATNDLVIRHQTDPTKFKIFGRKDAQIMLSTGEKTNPGPIEAIVCKDPRVEHAVMFGRGRDQNGMIIQPAKGHEIDPDDPVALARLRNDIWPCVDQANTFAPSHSRLYKAMILVTQPSKPFEKTAKLTPRRSAVLKAYASEIEAAYNAVQVPTETGVLPPSAWTPVEVLGFVRNLVRNILNKEVEDDADVFQHGADSLQATYIRNSIIQVVRQVSHKESAGSISQGFVYANPTIAALTKQLLDIEATPQPDGDKDILKLKELAAMISEFSADFPEHRPSIPPRPSVGEVVLLTGSTGGLGVQLLAHLNTLSDVSHVYALNRPSRNGRKSLRDRQAEALAEHGLDVGVLHSHKVTLVEGDISVPGFQLDSAHRNEICRNTTLIIHNAWIVNFNLALASFRPMVRGVRNLVDFALQSPQEAPPRIIFTGSVGVFRNWKAQDRPLEAPIVDPMLVMGGGYSESKWVGERILEEAANNTALRPIIVRIGQLTSNSTGAWNPGDWLPAIVRSGQLLGVLPARDDSIAWISLDTAAQALVDFRTSDSQYLHLAHPSPVPWSTAFGIFSSLLKVPLVPWDDWLSKLAKNGGDPEKNPAVHLLEFFLGCSSIGLENREALGVPLLDLTKALQSSPSLTDPMLPCIGHEDAARWIGYWRMKGLLTT